MKLIYLTVSFLQKKQTEGVYRQRRTHRDIQHSRNK
jgi:hypothetical protein